MRPSKFNHEKYKSYTIEKFLMDDCFIHSQKHPSEESETFWKEVIDAGLVNKYEFKTAHDLLNAIQVKPKRIINKEIFDLWENIEMRNKEFLSRIAKKDFSI